MTVSYSKLRDADSDLDEVPSAVPVVTPTSSMTGLVAQKLREKVISGLATLIIILVALGACMLCYLYCFNCLFFIVIACFACCLCVPGLNVPLWFAIILLTVGGYSFTNGRLTLMWH